MDAALELAMTATTNPRVMPSLRILGLGRIVNVAFLRRDQDLADLVSALMADLARAWPPGGLRTICRNSNDRGERLDPPK